MPPVVFLVEVRDLESGELVFRLRDAPSFNWFRDVDGSEGIALGGYTFPNKVSPSAAVVEVSMQKADRAWSRFLAAQVCLLRFSDHGRWPCGHTSAGNIRGVE